jgi:prepilin-type processing-associated H-X9-DG protein
LAANLLYCDGSVESIVEAKYCEMPLTQLKGSPFFLVAGDQIKAKVRGRNLNGWGPYSELTVNGALI